MNRQDLVDALEGHLGSKKAAEEALEAVLDVIIREVASGGKVSIADFGTFERAARADHTSRNSRTGETVKAKRTAVPKFMADPAFRAVVADPRLLPTAAPRARAAAGTPKKAGAKVAKRATATKAAPTRAAAKKAAPAKKASAKKAAPAKKVSVKKTTANKRSQPPNDFMSYLPGPRTSPPRPPRRK